MRGLRWLIALTISTWCVLMLAPPTSAAARTADLANCAQSASTLSALFVFDQSGSLATSDPSGIRYDALRIAVEQLATLTKNGGGTLAVEAAVSGFDHQYHPARSVARWTRFDAASFRGDGKAQAKTVDEFIDRARKGTEFNPQGGTDFEAALEGALSDLDDRSGPGNCRVLFWFTDGEFGTARDSVDVARKRMCGRGGLLDRIRQAGIVVVGLQLGTASEDLRSMSEGRGQSQTCGTVPIPTDWASGIYLRADDPAGLKRIFGSIGEILQGCTPTGSLKNQIDPGIRRFQVTIDTPRQISAFRIDAPDGTAINVAPSGTTQENGYAVTTTTTDDDFVRAEIAIPSGRPAGKWLMTTDPATTLDDAAFCVFHDLNLVMAKPKQELKAGVESEVVFHPVDRTGARADLSDFTSVAVGASAVGPDGKIRKASGSRRGNDILVTLTPLATDARLELSVTVQLKTLSKLTLTPLSERFKLPVLLAKEFPVVRPADQLDLGTAEKQKATSAPLHLIGSPLGPTQVCLDKPVKISVPRDAAGTEPQVATGCLDLKAGEARDVVVSVQPVAAAEGAGSAELPITLHSAATGKKKSQSVTYPLPVVWRFSNPLNTPVLIGVIIAVAAISVMLPLLALGLANVASAKFETSALQAGTVKLLVSSADLRRKDPLHEADRILDTFRDLVPLQVRSPRGFSVGDVQLQAKSTINPFGAPTFRAVAPPGHRIISSIGLPMAGDRAAAVSPALGFVALGVVADADLAAPGPVVAATLIVLQRDLEVDPQTLDRLVKQMPWDKIATVWRDGTDLDGSSAAPTPGPTDGEQSHLNFD